MDQIKITIQKDNIGDEGYTGHCLIGNHGMGETDLSFVVLSCPSIANIVKYFEEKIRFYEAQKIKDYQEAVLEQLDTFAQEWPVIVAEEGEEVAKIQFRKLAEKALEFCKSVTDKYPDGEKIWE